jgi:hypothetical protein
LGSIIQVAGLLADGYDTDLTFVPESCGSNPKKLNKRKLIHYKKCGTQPISSGLDWTLVWSKEVSRRPDRKANACAGEAAQKAGAARPVVKVRPKNPDPQTQSGRGKQGNAIERRNPNVRFENREVKEIRINGTFFATGKKIESCLVSYNRGRSWITGTPDMVQAMSRGSVR